MKTVFGVALLAFSLMMAAALPAEAAFILQSRKTPPPADQASTISQDITVRTDSSTPVDISDWTIHYYFYEGDVNTTFTGPTLTPSVPGQFVTFSKLDRTYSGPVRNANRLVMIWIPNGTVVSNTQSYTVSLSLGSNHGITQSDDWSYANNTNYANNTRITLQMNSGGTNWGSWPTHDRANQLTLAKAQIKHVVIIMQENRSFDNYFGSFPLAAGFSTPGGDTFPWASAQGMGVNAGGFFDLAPNGPGDRTGCDGLTYNPATQTPSGSEGSLDLPHDMYYAKKVFACPQERPLDRTCSTSFGDGDPLYVKDFLQATSVYRGCDPVNQSRTVAHYDGSTSSTPLWNYWTFAKTFMLQDRMFSPVPSYSLMSHLFMVSNWSANCTAQPCPAGSENYDGLNPQLTGPYGWNNIANAMSAHSPAITWGYYKGENFNYNCASCTNTNVNTTCLCYTNPINNCFSGNSGSVIDYWNPLASFVGADTSKIQNVTNFLTAVSQVNGTTDNVPAVSWIVPGNLVSEHPGQLANTVHLKRGQAYVTMLLQQMIKNATFWNKTAVFVAWDDWGGFYDHVRPPKDGNGKLLYGVRVPGITISRWLGMGPVDHQTLSFDGYNKLIEDLFLNSARLSGDGRPVENPANKIYYRENEPVLGNLLDEFDFRRTPLSVPSSINGLKCYNP